MVLLLVLPGYVQAQEGGGVNREVLQVAERMTDGGVFPEGVQQTETGVQRLTLEQVVALAVKNSPRLQIAESQIEMSRAGRGEVAELPATEFSYSWGTAERRRPGRLSDRGGPKPGVVADSFL